MNTRQWRKKPSEELIRLMEESIDITLYLIHEKGPLSLTFQDEDGSKYQVTIGNDISCSCGGGKTEHCIHTVYALNRIYKIPFSNQLIFQLHFSDSELTKLLEMKNEKNNKIINSSNNKKAKIKKSKLKNSEVDSKQMSLLDDIVCAICQEDLYKAEGIYFCSNSCGHNFHINCLKIFFKHKRENSQNINCPMCRANWNEGEFDNILSKTATYKCTKGHRGIDCKNCGRSGIKFERFHCLICENYDLCVECFAEGIHKDLGHPFIVKKTNDDKWYGCEYLSDELEESDLNNKKVSIGLNEGRYVLKNIFLSHFLSMLLKDFSLENDEGENSEIDKIQCALCKKSEKLINSGKNLRMLGLKSLFNCNHCAHSKCCEKLFKIYNYDSHNRCLVVDKCFNKCQIDNTPIFKGLLSVKTAIHEKKEESYDGKMLGNKNNNAFGLNSLFVLGNAKDGTINNRANINNGIRNLMYRKNSKIHFMKDRALINNNDNFGDPLGLAFNIQKVNFDNDNDIHKFEANIIKPTTSNNKNMKPRGNLAKIPYRRVPSRKKAEVIVARNKGINEEKNDILQNNGDLHIQKIPIYNARPKRIENEHKFSLSPILANINFDNNNL